MASALVFGAWKMPRKTEGFSFEMRTGRIGLGAELDPRHVLEAQGGFAAGAGADDDLAELLRIAQAAERIDLHLEGGAVGRRRLAELAGRDLDVLARRSRSARRAR